MMIVQNLELRGKYIVVREKQVSRVHGLRDGFKGLHSRPISTLRAASAPSAS